jgi:hypothetical protein
MKKKLLGLIILFFSTISLSAQNYPAPDPTWEVPVKFDKETHDYGSIPFESDGSCTFTFNNSGKEPLLIVAANASCGCTVPDYSKEPIAPGKTGTIKVTYDTKRVGAINKNVNLIFQNASKSKTGSKTIFIVGNVLAKVE